MAIFKYIVKRVINMIIVLFLLANLNFFLFEYVPMAILGLGVSFFVPYKSAQQALLGPVIYQSVIKEFGLDKPWPIRYESYLKNIFTGNFGYGISAISGHEPVWSIISTYAPNSIFLLGVSTVLSIILGAYVGIVSASKRGKFVDISSVSVGIFSYSIPSFWIGLIVLYFFAVKYHFFPISLGAATIGPGNVPLPVGSLAYIKAYLWAGTLPILVLTLISFGSFQLIMRNTLNDVLTEDYIMIARAKGLSERAVLYKHAFRNALLPLVTSMALAFGFILSGAVITETIFNFTGLGWATLRYIEAFDYPVIQGIFFLIGVMVVVANFLADIAYGFLDPRVSY
jgi:peptide/nickel transport system permease protein